MRLTLRTLLAYLDDILDPTDKEQLAQKIESSEFAEDLVHRTRDTVRRLRLSAPQVIGSGMGLDPNTVAEYLDNVLPPESVGDFERICLESDMHLAEAAACHHVLTMVLGEPADVDPLVRQRMYTIPEESEQRKRVRVETTQVSLGAVPAAAAPIQVVASPAGVIPEPVDGNGVPEYLRTSSWTGYQGAILALAAVVLVGTAFLLFSGMRGWFGGKPQVSALTADTTANVVPNPLNADEQTAAAANVRGEVPDRPVTDQQAVDGQTTAASPQPLTPEVSSSPSTSTAAPPEDQYAAPPENAAAGPEVVPPDSAATPADAVAEERLSSEASDGETSPNDLSPSGETVTALPTEPVMPDDSTGADLAADDASAPAGTDAADGNAAATESEAGVETALAGQVPAGPVEIGTYLGGKTVLLRYDDQSGAWFRVQPRSAVIAGERLLSLPEFRPEISLASGLQVEVSGGTQVTLRAAEGLSADGLPAAGADVPAIEMIYGRVVLINRSDVENTVRVAFGSSVGDARVAPHTRLGIEVERQYVRGRDPRQSPAPVVARLFAPDGDIVWQDAGGTKTINNASRWTISEGVASEVVADSSPPDWIGREPIVQLSEQRYGAPTVESTLVSDKPADIQLLELFQGNVRKEVKSLAAKSSIHVGVFGPFVDALRDSEQKSNWRIHIETLRAAMALSPESAAKVKQALVEQRGTPAADDLYEMLCGYNEEQIGQTPDQVKSGALVRLIDWLEEDSLDYRVLAVHDLWEITGKRLMRDPTANPKERAQNVRSWRSRLEEGELYPVRR